MHMNVIAKIGFNIIFVMNNFDNINKLFTKTRQPLKVFCRLNNKSLVHKIFK